jgi:lipoprotein-releasing system permease protein
VTFLFLQRFLFSKKSGSVIKAIAWLTLVANLISVAALILVISVMTALNESIERRTLKVEPHAVVTFPGKTNPALVKIDPVVAKFSELGLETEFFEKQDLIVKTSDGRFRGAVAVGMSPESIEIFFERIQGTEYPKGRLIKDEIIMGSDLAASLGLIEGDWITVFPPENLLASLGEALHFEKAQVANIVVTNLPDLDAQMILYDPAKALLKLKSSVGRQLGFNLWMKKPHFVDDLKKTLSAFSGVKVETWKERNAALLMSLRLEKLMITIFLTMASLIAGISVISALVLLISQKRKEISVLHTMGMSKIQLRNLFFKMGFSLASSGLAFGLVLGVSLGLYLQWFPLKILPDIYYDTSIQASVRPSFVLIVLIVGVLFSAVGSFFVSQQILQTSVRDLSR